MSGSSCVGIFLSFRAGMLPSRKAHPDAAKPRVAHVLAPTGSTLRLSSLLSSSDRASTPLASSRASSAHTTLVTGPTKLGAGNGLPGGKRVPTVAVGHSKGTTAKSGAASGAGAGAGSDAAVDMPSIIALDHVNSIHVAPRDASQQIRYLRSSNLRCVVRAPPPGANEAFSKKQDTKEWRLEDSVFAKFKHETTLRVNSAFEADWRRSRLRQFKLVKDKDELALVRVSCRRFDVPLVRIGATLYTHVRCCHLCAGVRCLPRLSPGEECVADTLSRDHAHFCVVLHCQQQPVWNESSVLLTAAPNM